MSQMIDSIKSFISRWYNRFKIFCYIFAIWAVIYSTISICGFSLACEYDDAIVYTQDAREIAIKQSPQNIYQSLNQNVEYERTKIIPFLTLNLFKILGFKIDLILDREAINIQNINKKWKNLADGIYFVTDQNQKYEILESQKYLFFFSNSDEGIIQAKKANIKPIRIKRNPKSTLNKLSYNPGKFKETILPLSEF